jgi:hypothetical protein
MLLNVLKCSWPGELWLAVALFLLDSLSGEFLDAVVALAQNEFSAMNYSPLDVTVARGISCLFAVIDDFSICLVRSFTVVLLDDRESEVSKFELIARTFPPPTGLPSSSL